MKKLEKIKTKNEILELQKNEEITITITKKQIELITFTLLSISAFFSNLPM